MSEIIQYPDYLLRSIAKPVTVVNSDIEDLIADMLKTVQEAGGVGLAAPQIGVLQRIIVLNLPGRTPRAYINPVLSGHKGGTNEVQEGCLSIRGITATIRRHKQVTMEAYEFNGWHVYETLTGVAAAVAQHEVDHLDGKLFIDRLSHVQSVALRKQLEALYA